MKLTNMAYEDIFIQKLYLLFLNINSTELGLESQRIVQQKYFPLGMDLEHVKKNFPITYELNMIVCLQHLLVEYTKNQGSWRETPSSGLISIFQEDKPFECKEFSIDLDLENIKHTFRVPKQNNVLIDTFPDLKILLSAGYINNKGRLRKYEKTAKKIIIGQRVIKKSYYRIFPPVEGLLYRNNWWFLRQTRGKKYNFLHHNRSFLKLLGEYA